MTPVITRRGFLGAAATVGALAAGCGLSRDGKLGDGTGEITVWTWPDNDRTFNETKVFFEKEHPEVKVNVQGFSGNFNSKLLGALVSGTGPDVAMVEITSVTQFVTKPGFVDLRAAPFKAEQYADRYADFSWNYAVNPDGGKVSLLPKNTGPGGMFYRRDIFEEVGLPSDPAEVHEAMPDWDTFVEVGKKVVKKGERWLLDDPAQLVAAIRGQQGVSYFDEDGNPQLANDVFISALELAIKLQSDGIMAPDTTAQERGANIGSGKIATIFSGNWFGAFLKVQYAPKDQGKWGVALPPATDGVSAFNYGGDFIGILQASNHQLAAWKFVQWVTQSSASLEAMYSRDLYPAWLPALEEDWINKPDPYYGDQNVNEVYSEVSKTMKPPVTNPNDAIANTAFSMAVTDAVHGVRSPRAALQRAEQDVEDKMT